MARSEEKTDFHLLLIVGLVAMVAITVLFMEQDTTLERKDSATAGQATTFEAGSLPDHEGRWDYDSDGRYTVSDSTRLADAISINQCPPSADCDIDNDGVLTMRDLETYNAYVREETEPNTFTGQFIKIRAPSTLNLHIRQTETDDRLIPARLG